MDGSKNAAWSLLLVASLAACGGPRLLMRDATSREIPTPAAERARVVLVAPGSYRDVISIVDERGRYLGQLGGRTFFQLELEPGPRKLYALTDASEFVVTGELEAGRTYWIKADTAFARPVRWLAWETACNEDVRARLEGVRAVEPDPRADAGALARQLGDVPQRLLEADAELAAMREEARAERRLTPACAEATPAASAPAATSAAPAASEPSAAPATSATP